MVEGLTKAADETKTSEGTAADEDVELIELERGILEVDLTRKRLLKIEGFDFLERVERLCLRWNLLKRIEGLDRLTTLTELDLYDNQIEKLEGLEALVGLRHLDVSFNRLKKIEGLETLTQLRELFLVHNKLTRIEGIEQYLELGDNRIRRIEGLEQCMNLRRLFLGANQITRIENLRALVNLEVLSLPGNAITAVPDLSTLEGLRELYLSQNGIQVVDGIANNFNLEVNVTVEGNMAQILDISYNRVEKVVGLRRLTKLTDFWAKSNKLPDWSVVEDLATLERLSCVYLEMNPFSTRSLNTDGEEAKHEYAEYRSRTLSLLTHLWRLDANMVA